MEKFKDIDKYLKASDIVEMFERERIRSEENGRKYRRSDGFAKRGMATAVMAAEFAESAAKWSLKVIEKEMNKHNNGFNQERNLH